MRESCRFCAAYPWIQFLGNGWARILALVCLSVSLYSVPVAASDAATDSTKAGNAAAESNTSGENSDHAMIQDLLGQIESLKQRVAELESHESSLPNAEASPAISPAILPGAAAGGTSSGTAKPPNQPGAPMAMPPAKPALSSDAQGGHDMTLPGGPVLNIRGFLDFNFDAGSVANPLIYPLTIPPPATVHDTFQFGEFDLFMSSRLSTTVSFLSELVFGTDATNEWGIDLERAQITYKPSEYFQISGGRMHTAIGFYNTAYHHGTWFQTATGRPYMYFYEDSGGILPVHIVGIEASGAVPGLQKVNAHWIAEVGNGESSDQLVQNFVSDTDHKAFNLAGYIKVAGVQIGGNYYNNVRVPSGVPHVNNVITGAYVVYITRDWEFLNELQVQRDHSFGSAITYNTPLGYTQFSHKFGKYRPYVRWQEVNVPVNDPLYGSVGRFEGPSFGLRMDFADYAALKVQYNRIYTRDPDARNGLDGQVSFTF